MIVHFALKVNADSIKLIDENFFTSNFVSDDLHATQLIINTVNMMKQYNMSVIIFDLDSISGVHKQYNAISSELASASNAALAGTTFQYCKMRP